MAVSAAAVSSFMLMMIAHDIGIVIQPAGQEILYSLICTADHPAIKTDSGLRKRILCSAAYAAANQYIDLIAAQDAR